MSKHCCRRYARRTRAKLTQLRRDSQYFGQSEKALGLKIDEVSSELAMTRQLSRLSLEHADGSAARASRHATNVSSKFELTVALVTQAPFWNRLRYLFTRVLKAVNE